MNHKTTEALGKLKDVELEILRLRNALDMMDKAYEKKKEWVGLTDVEFREFEVWLDNDEEQHGWNPPENIVKYLESKLKEKNSGCN